MIWFDLGCVAAGLVAVVWVGVFALVGGFGVLWFCWVLFLRCGLLVVCFMCLMLVVC